MLEKLFCWKRSTSTIEKSQHLDAMDALVHGLPNAPTLADIAPSLGSSHKSRYVDVECGAPIEEWGLFNQSVAAISICQGTKGSTSKEHVHPNETEYYVVLRGSVISIQRYSLTDKHKLVLKPGNVGDFICIPKGISHRLKIVKDASVVVITVPTASGMPISPSFEGIIND